MVYFLVAMEREAEMLELENIYITGINATNLPETTDDDILVNVGLCGSYEEKPGRIVEPIISASTDHSDFLFIDHKFPVKRMPCITAPHFVTKHEAEYNCIYDMELYKLASLPHKKIYSLKIVSDKLNENCCEEFNSERSWRVVNDLLKDEEW